jgi:hypothetical protein
MQYLSDQKGHSNFFVSGILAASLWPNMGTVGRGKGKSGSRNTCTALDDWPLTPGIVPLKPPRLQPASYFAVIEEHF